MKGCPQGGVLSPLLWSLVVDDLLRELSRYGYTAIGYADDLVIITKGKYHPTISELMMGALEIVQNWCKKEGLRVNPDKTVLIPFTKRRKKEDLKRPLLFGKRLQFSSEVKYLGLVLDSKLLWNRQVERIEKKAQITLVMMWKTCGKTWGLTPRIAHWIYCQVVRPMITYGSLVWWPKVEQSTTRARLSSIQRRASLLITGALRSSPTAALEAILNLPPLDIWIKGEAWITAQRLKIGSVWKNRHKLGHPKILEVGIDVPLDVDRIPPIFNFYRPFSIIFPSREKWSQKEGNISGDVVWYTDGSRMEGSSGAGIYGPSPETAISYSLGKHATVFQSELLAIRECVNINLERKYVGKRITIFSDSQAALKALEAGKVNSRLVLECVRGLQSLGRKNFVTLSWIPGHEGIEGNEKADELAKQGSSDISDSTKPAYGVSGGTIRRLLREWTKREHDQMWASGRNAAFSRLMLPRINGKITMDILQLSRGQIRAVVGLITGHCHLRHHLKRIGTFHGDSSCRRCGQEEETAHHVLFDCEALALYRYTHLKISNNGISQENFIRDLLDFIRSSNLLT